MSRNQGNLVLEPELWKSRFETSMIIRVLDRWKNVIPKNRFSGTTFQIRLFGDLISGGRKFSQENRVLENRFLKTRFWRHDFSDRKSGPGNSVLENRF